MSDAFYKFVRFVGRPAFWVSSRPVVLHAERLDVPGPLLIAPNHLSPYDVPCLMASTRQLLDFVSIVELFRNPLTRGFLTRMNAFPLDRGRVDAATTRRILDRLARGRKVVMFSEGQIRTAATSLLAGGSFKPTVARLVSMAGVPVVPCVMLGTGAYARSGAWLPGARTRYAVNFAEPIRFEKEGADDAAAATAANARLRQAYDALYAELSTASGLIVTDSPWRPAPAPAATTA
jgi:1-acyl-sn-glycerol-3-phosphate acyltransferase